MTRTTSYEPSDAPTRPVYASLFGTVLLLVLMGWLLRQWSIAGGTSTTPAPAELRLMIEPRQELQALQAEHDRMLHSYGWVDREAGRARIPIDQAMELLARQADRGGGAP